MKYLLLFSGLCCLWLSLESQTVQAPQSDQTTTDTKSVNKANPGDRIRNQVTISETGAAIDATGVQLNAVPDANTTFVVGAFHSQQRIVKLNLEIPMLP